VRQIIIREQLPRGLGQRRALEGIADGEIVAGRIAFFKVLWEGVAAAAALPH
jgi:hypothetical protein